MYLYLDYIQCFLIDYSHKHSVDVLRKMCCGIMEEGPGGTVFQLSVAVLCVLVHPTIILKHKINKQY